MRPLTYLKMATAAIVCCVGGPALVYYVQPDPDELFQKYNPELRKRALAEREKKKKEYGEFLEKLHEYSKRDKPIWLVVAQEDARKQAAEMETRARKLDEREKQRFEILSEERKRNQQNV